MFALDENIHLTVEQEIKSNSHIALFEYIAPFLKQERLFVLEKGTENTFIERRNRLKLMIRISSFYEPHQLLAQGTRVIDQGVEGFLVQRHHRDRSFLRSLDRGGTDASTQ